jgi:hypothetical protein
MHSFVCPDCQNCSQQRQSTRLHANGNAGGRYFYVDVCRCACSLCVMCGSALYVLCCRRNSWCFGRGLPGSSELRLRFTEVPNEGWRFWELSKHESRDGVRVSLTTWPNQRVAEQESNDRRGVCCKFECNQNYIAL